MSEQTYLHDETQHAQLLRRLAQGADTSQRELAAELGMSLGKVNYCLKALLAKGYIKAVNFKNSDNKRAYLYQLTPAGIAAKSRITAQFLARKQAEYERLKQEITELQHEIAQTQKPSAAAAS
ncbi:MarR family EPS-associated transcriptional regulator [Azonexus sp.]|uniref:MarR family EPS-associated transcriptional regulator n=1 Tax=Azonexus sp. TaxID=1872668 RepID=UPI0039E31191